MFDKRAYDDYIQNYEDSFDDERIESINSDWQIDEYDAEDIYGEDFSDDFNDGEFW